MSKVSHMRRRLHSDKIGIEGCVVHGDQDGDGQGCQNEYVFQNKERVWSRILSFDNHSFKNQAILKVTEHVCHLPIDSYSIKSRHLSLLSITNSIVHFSLKCLYLLVASLS